MENIQEHWGGFSIVHNSVGNAYRAVAYPGDRAKASGLPIINVTSQSRNEALKDIYEKIAVSWQPVIDLDSDITQRATNIRPHPHPHTNHCHYCKHGLSSRYMPVCKACERSICFNCRSCLCGYPGLKMAK